MATPKKKASQRVLLLDGYNVIRTGYLYSHLAGGQVADYTQDAYNTAREMLLSDVAIFAGKEYAATAVFDGKENPDSGGVLQKFGTVEYLFSPAGVSADTIIESRANKAARGGLEVLVVSSDASVQWTVFGRLVRRMSATNFCDEVQELQKNLQQAQKTGAGYKNTSAHKLTLAERINPEVCARLKHFVRGGHAHL